MLSLLHRYKQTFSSDFVAGLTGAVAGAPQSMGFAILGGVSPIYGLYASIIPTILGAFFSGSTLITVAPTNVLMLLVAGAMATFGSQNPPVALFTFTLLVGVFQLLFGLFRLGNLTRFISNAVIVGFISGAGVLIVLGQLHHVTGYPVPTSSNALYNLGQWIQHLPETRWQTLVIGAATIAVITALHHTRLKNVASLTAILITATFVQIAGWTGVELVRNIAHIPSGLPAPIWPDLSIAPELATAALATALLASMQSAALTEKLRDSTDSEINSEININRDFVAQGAANIAGGMFQALPSSGSLSRTAVNISAGARTRMSNVYAGLLILLIMVLFSNLLAAIPLASLAGNLIVAAVSLIDRQAIRMAWRSGWPTKLTLGITLFSTLIVPLEYSIYTGIFLSLLLYIYTSSNTVEVVELVRTPQNRYVAQKPPGRLPDHQPIILSVHGPLHFGAVSKMEHLLPKHCGVQQPVVILRLREATSLGSTATRFLLRYDRQLKKCGGKLIVSGINQHLKEDLEYVLTDGDFVRQDVFPAQPMIFEATDHALEHAMLWLHISESESTLPKNQP